ncbi:ABC transporter substrate-binding protein [Thermodesulfobacteriota bacterium]
MKPKGMCFLIIFLAATIVFSGIDKSEAKKPVTLAELALYQGADRQQILEEGARKEGKLVLYTTATQSPTIVKAFQQKYPYIRVERWRAPDTKLVSRVAEEYSVGRYIVDVIGSTQFGEIVLEEKNLLQEYYSPQLANIDEGTIKKGKQGGAFSAGHFQSGIGLAYNSKQISPEELPQTYQDLLDPKWKGILPIGATSTGITWMGNMFETFGEEFIKKLSQQNFVPHAVSGRAILDMVIGGEYLFTPTGFDSHVRKSKKKQAQVGWKPLEPVASYIGQIMLPKHSTRSHAALLYIDFDLSKTGGELWKSNGYNSPRKDVPGERNYVKYYGPYSTNQVTMWSNLFNKYFVKK